MTQSGLIMSRKAFDPHGQSDKARQGLLDNRSEKKPKNHRTIKRRKSLSAAKRARVKSYLTKRDKQRGEFLAKARAYWRGQSDGHP
jgi:hypothetical protein